MQTIRSDFGKILIWKTISSDLSGILICKLAQIQNSPLVPLHSHHESVFLGTAQIRRRSKVRLLGHGWVKAYCY